MRSPLLLQAWQENTMERPCIDAWGGAQPPAGPDAQTHPWGAEAWRQELCRPPLKTSVRTDGALLPHAPPPPVSHSGLAAPPRPCLIALPSLPSSLRCQRSHEQVRPPRAGSLADHQPNGGAQAHTPAAGAQGVRLCSTGCAGWAVPIGGQRHGFFSSVGRARLCAS